MRRAASGRAVAGVGAPAPARVGSSRKGRQRSGVFATGRAGRGHCATPTVLLGPQPGSTPNSEEPSLLSLPPQGGGPSKPLQASWEPGDLRDRGEEAREPGDERACARPAASRGPPSGAEPAPTGQRERPSLQCPPLRPDPRARNQCGLKKEFRCSEIKTGLSSQTIGLALPVHWGWREGARAVGEEKDGETRRNRLLGSPQPGPEHSYPSRAGAVAACRPSAAAASAPSAARSRLLLSARGLRTLLPWVEEGAGTPQKEPDKSPSAAARLGAERPRTQRCGRSAPARPGRPRHDCPRARLRRSCLRAYPRSARAPGDYHWGAR